MNVQYTVCLLFTLITLAKPKATIHLKLHSLIIEGDKNICDSGLLPTACDLYLKICFRGERNATCDMFITTPRRAFVDRNKIAFGNKIGYMENPVSVEVSEISNSPQLTIEVHDADFTIFDKDDHLTTVSLENFTIPTIPTIHSVEYANTAILQPEGVPVNNVSRTVAHNVKISLWFSIWARCFPTFYGDKCDKECSPNDTMEGGHYGCDLLTGGKICLFGWYGENCTQVDVCATKRPCGLMGKCINTPDGFRCICRPPFKGPLCDQLSEQCLPETESTDGSQKFSFCLNDAFCMVRRDHEASDEEQEELDKPKPPQCICRPGFIGSRCERDLDECTEMPRLLPLIFNHSSKRVSDMLQKQWAVHCFTVGHVARPCCGPDAQCTNTYGGYRCICPDGWTGPHCEYPPTLWPKGYHPMANWTNDNAQLESLVFSMDSFTNENEDPSDSSGHGTIWTNAFVALFVVFLILLIFIIVYLFMLKRRRKSKEVKQKLPSVRYTRPTAPSGLTSPPLSAQTTLSERGPRANTLARPFIAMNSPNITGGMFEDDGTTYEELSYHLCYHQSDDPATTYDSLDDNANHSRTSTTQSTGENKSFYPVYSEKTPSETRDSPYLHMNESYSGPFPHLVCLQSRSLMQPDGSELVDPDKEPSPEQQLVN